MNKSAVFAGGLGLLLSVVGCTEANPGYVPPSNADVGGSWGDGSLGPDVGVTPPPGRCTPGEFVECVGPMGIRRCRQDGQGTETRSCEPFRCNPVQRRCDACDPYAPPQCQGRVLVTCTDGVPGQQDCGDAGCDRGQCRSGCAPRTWYRDDDGDGFGDPSQSRSACQRPGGYVENNRDCDDKDKDAHPGQQGWFTQPTDGKKNFDYNCDGAATRRYPSQAACHMQNGKCGGDGYYGLIPECGQTGVFARCELRTYGGCIPVSIGGRQQSCH